ncbi:MAG: tRNA 2-thiocytidine(32) synthetase TtcA [Blastocatellia bacterium]|nr:tRNA 2-thiocytidine(32) synthetase TtcA [Blastocatellia bacterium]
MKSFETLQKILLRRVGDAIQDFHMIEAGDRVMVCLSGGKDSYTMLELLMILQRKSPVKFEILAVNLDQKQPNFPADVLPRYFTEIGVPFLIVEEDTYSTVKRLVPEGETTCSVCARLRRGILYGTAVKHGCNKIALGHHADDLLETFLLNLFYIGTIKTMPPILRSDDGRNTVIRPMAYLKESQIADYAARREFPIIPCDLCGSQPNLKRKMVKNLLLELERDIPRVKNSMMAAMGRIHPSHMLDKSLYNFRNFQAQSGDVEAELDDALGLNHNEHELLAAHSFDFEDRPISLPVLQNSSGGL